ncbi:hypothetical protein GQX74_003076 [Glossina fuscipes]|nr:hypothetical protein GQX74_003076 [Glossina fuscipes]
MVNRLNLIISDLPEGLNDIPGTVIKIAEHYSVTIALHDISFAGYMKNDKTISVKLNWIVMRGELMGKYFKNINVRPLCVYDPKFIQEILRQRINLIDRLRPAAGELNKACVNFRKKSKIVRFRIGNGIRPYAILVLADGNTAKLDLQGCKEMLGITFMINAE